MMPASSSRPPPAHSLPPLDEATSIPFSALFDSNHFDMATVEATAQLADRSIFVMPNGRRFLFESIPEPQNPHPIRSSPNPYPPLEEYRQPQAQPQAQPQPQPRRQPQFQPVQPVATQQSYYQYQYQQPQLSPRTSPTAQDLEALRRNNAPVTIRRRPLSNASSNPYSPGGGRNPDAGGQSPGTEPKVQTHEVTTMMANLDIHQTPRFGAAPLFDHSDGGVQAAEALIEPYVGPMNEMSPGSPYSPSASPAQQSTRRTAAHGGRQSFSDHPPNTTHVTQIHSFNYPNYMAQAYQAQEAARQAAASPAKPQYESLMEHSTPMPAMTATSEQQYYASWSASPISPQIEASEAQLVMNGGNSSASARDYPPPPTTATSERAASLSLSYHQSRHPSYSNLSTAGRGYPYAGNGFDTQTPVVVIDPEPQPERHPSSTSTMDSRSTGRENIMPGEDLLYDG